jgi:hypothetical protein
MKVLVRRSRVSVPLFKSKHAGSDQESPMVNTLGEIDVKHINGGAADSGTADEFRA